MVIIFILIFERQTASWIGNIDTRCVYIKIARLFCATYKKCCQLYNLSCLDFYINYFETKVNRWC